MAGMSRNNSTSSVQGFSVFQNSLGAPLQFLPALGTKQLDDLIDAYVPGSASIQEKRAQVSMDFFEYAQQTGETFKYYPVFSASFGSTTDSPASSAMQDSGYGSAFNVSPVMSDLAWSQSTAFTSPSQSFMPSTPAQQKARTSFSKKASTSASKTQTTDFSHLPGMKIMTKDGQDVTNSASRGCKTKEQRDHAHLMRILKACDACKKKKIRCDPSHRKAARTASQASVQPEAKPAKKVKKSASPSQSPPPVSPEVALAGASFEMAPAPAAPVEDFTQFAQEPWDQFLQYDQEPTMAIPDDYDFFFDPEGYFSPSTGSSTSPVQPITPMVSAQSAGLYNDNYALTSTDSQEPILPYLHPDGHTGSNYVDFNLYSPASSFLDEEPQPLQKKSDGTLVDQHVRSQGGLKKRVQGRSVDAFGSGQDGNISAPQSQFTGGVHDQDWSFDWAQSSFDATDPRQGVPGNQPLTTAGVSPGNASPGLSRRLPTNGLDNANPTGGVPGLQHTSLANTGLVDLDQFVDFTYASEGASQSLGGSPSSTVSSSGVSQGVSLTDTTSTNSSQTSLASSPAESTHSGYNPRRKPGTLDRLQTPTSHVAGVSQSDLSDGCRVSHVSSDAASSAVLDERHTEFNRKQNAIQRAVSAQGLPSGVPGTSPTATSTNAGVEVLDEYAENRRTRRGATTAVRGPSQFAGTRGLVSATALGVSGVDQTSSSQPTTELSNVTYGGLSQATSSTQQAALSSVVAYATAVAVQPQDVEVVDQQSSSRLTSGLPSHGGVQYPTSTLVNLLVASVLLLTLPVRQIVAGFSHGLGKTSRLSSQSSLSVAFGLASLALAFTLQSAILANLSGQHSLPMIVLSLAPFALRHEKPYTPSTRSSSETLFEKLPSALVPSAMSSIQFMA